MKPINYAERRRTIAYFAGLYLATALIIGFLTYFSILIIPREQNKLTNLTNGQVQELIHYMDSADSLAIQIQKAPVVSAKALVPFYSWTSDLQSVYKQPFYTTIIASYVNLVEDIAQSKSGDTMLIAAKNQMIALQKENLDLQQKQRELLLDLKSSKSQ